MGQLTQIAQRADRKAEKGFTLVELAIVMIIIGLLIGGVLKGQQLIENARVTATISQVKGFQAALNSFRDTYSATPGDMRNATTRLSGCNAAANCVDGSGNSLIIAGELAAGGGDVDQDSETAIVVAADETVNSWKHLALADLITGVDPTSDTGAADLAWGQTHPSSSLRGGYEIFYDSDVTADGTLSGHVLRMSNGGLTGNVGTEGAAPASGLQAANIDRKLDDGRRTTGTVVGGGGDCESDADEDAYDEQSDQKNCVPMFLIDG